MKPLTIMYLFRKSAFIVVCAFIISACEDRSHPNVLFWVPLVTVEKGDGQAKLVLTDPTPFTDYVGGQPVNPDYFNIMISEDLQNFSLYQRVDYLTSSIVIENLINDKAYYFVVQVEKELQPAINSNTVMTIPSKEKKISDYLSDSDHIYTRLSTSFDAHYLAYFNQLTLYFKSNDSQIPTVADEDVQEFAWSPTANEAIFVKYERVGSVLYSHQLRKVQPQTNTSTVIFEIPNHEYSIFNPQYSPSGKQVTFISDEGFTPNVWNLDLASGDKTRISDFSTNNFHIYSGFDWFSSADELLLDGRYDLSTEPSSIYSWTVSSNILKSVIKSQWNDARPTLSPDNNKIAFISDRTGNWSQELWTFDKTNQKYSQITGGTSYTFDARYSNIQWVNDSQILITVYENDRWRVVKIDVN